MYKFIYKDLLGETSLEREDSKLNVIYENNQHDLNALMMDFSSFLEMSGYTRSSINQVGSMIFRYDMPECCLATPEDEEAHNKIILSTILNKMEAANVLSPSTIKEMKSAFKLDEEK